jgi:hypothetical protein
VEGIPEQHETVGEWVTIAEAAKRLGVSVDTVRRRVKDGSLTSQQLQRPQGFTWQVFLADAQQPPAPTQQSLGELVSLVRDLQKENRDLAGQLGYMQAQLQQAQEEVRLLRAPEVPPVVENAAESPAPRPWWRFWDRASAT